MELGLNLVMVRPTDMPAIAARAEEVGYGSVFVPDHVVFPVRVESPYPYTPDGSFPFALDTPLYDPWVILTSIAGGDVDHRARHRDLRPPAPPSARHRPGGHVLDVLSGGRAILGVGAGWLAEEFTTLGLEPKRRFSRTEECIEVLRALWTAGAAGVPRASLRLRPGALRAPPGPARRIPPILLGGDSDHALAARRAVRRWLDLGRGRHRRRARSRSGSRPSARSAATMVESDAFEITILLPRPTPDDLARLDDLGVDRVVVMPWNRGRDAIPALEAFAETAIGSA